MAVDSLGFGSYYANSGVSQITPEQQKKFIDAKKRMQYVNPFKDKVYIDPKTGEYTTWKPGIYNPEQNDSNKTAKKALTLAAVVAAAITAFIFRGKIKAGGQKVLDLAKPYIDKLVKNTPKSVKDVVKKGINFVKPAFTKAKDLVTKGYDIAKPYVTKLTEFATKKVYEPIKNFFVKGPAAKVKGPAAKAAEAVAKA